MLTFCNGDLHIYRDTKGGMHLRFLFSSMIAKNIDAWEEAGGIGIVHTSAKNTKRCSKRTQK